jgi:tyrosyl-tRNA synthetase
MKADMKSGALHPRAAKVRLGEALVSRFHGAAAGRAAVEEFDRIFVNKGLPDEMPEFEAPASKFAGEIDVAALLKEYDLVASTSDARRLLQSNSVEIDGQKITAVKHKFDFSSGQDVVLKVGKKKFAKLHVK